MKAAELRHTLQVLVTEWGRGESLRTLLALSAVAEGQPLPQRVLQDTLGVDATAAFLMVKRLMAQGLIDQAIDPVHRSHRLLMLTPKGAALLRSAGVTA